MAEIITGMDSFSLDGVHFGNIHGVYIGKSDNSLWTENLTPPVEQYTESVVGGNLTYVFGETLKPRPITLKCFISKVTESEIRNLQKALTFNGKSKKLILDRKPYKYINVFLSGQIDWDYIWNYTVGLGNNYNCFFDIPLIAYDPLYYSDFLSSNIYQYFESAGTNPIARNDAGIPYGEVLEDNPSSLTNIIIPTAFDIYSGGSYKSKCEILLIGSATNLVITNTTSNETFTINSMSAESILINGNKGMVTDGAGTVLKTSKFTGDFINVLPLFNSFTLTATSVNLTVLNFNYRYTYL